jgi:multidrug resistance efflux pump
MELLLALIYVSICIAIFKIFKIPVNQWSLSTAVLGGIVGIFLLLLVMNYNHPFTNNARIYFPVTPILPNVKGRVVEVPVHANTPLKEGDVLFRIDRKPYEYVVAEKQAALAEAEQNVKQLKASLDQVTAQAERADAQLQLQLKASLDQVTAQAERADAQLQLTQQNYDRQAQLFKANVVAQATLDTATRNLDASKQTLAAATEVLTPPMFDV